MADKPLIKNEGNGLYIQINSRSFKEKGVIRPLAIRIKKDLELLLKVPILNEINVIILLKALGLTTDRQLTSYITYNEFDNDMIHVT